MRKAIVLTMLTCLVFTMSVPALAYDETGTVGLGYRFGLHTIAKTPWKMKFMHGGEFKLGLHPRIALAVTGTYGRTTGAKLDASAFPAKFASADKDDAARLYMRNYIVEFGPVINLMPEESFNIFITGGAGFGAWSVKGVDGKTVSVSDGEGGMLALNDQQMTLMIGAGFEWWPWESVPQLSFGASARYHYFTTAFSNFRNPTPEVDQLTGSNGLDLPSGLFEFGVGVTAYFSKCPDEDLDGVCDDKDQCPGTPECADSVDENGCPYDSDGDGVVDGCDSCANTPMGCKVDLKGCPYDSDEDGVCDGIDKCPDTQKGCKVDAAGCAIDSDKDGVPDCRDNCPDTPTCARVDANGCPLDSDNDGVSDGCDKCPGTPPGYTVDSDGCPTGVPKPTRTNLSMRGVNFISGSFKLTPASKDSLNSIANELRAFPATNIQVNGYCDSQGRTGYNDTLSVNRAKAVVDYLMGQGLDKARFTVVGHGENDPIGDNKTAEGRRKNRRVELVPMQ